MPQASNWPGGAFSMRTSAWTASFFRISRPSSVSRLRVTDSLFRASWRKCGPTGSPRSLSWK
jgi:hypothetical protein